MYIVIENNGNIMDWAMYDCSVSELESAIASAAGGTTPESINAQFRIFEIGRELECREVRPTGSLTFNEKEAKPLTATGANHRPTSTED